MFYATDNKGFKLTFKNGWTISVQFGPGNYCNNREDAYDTYRTKTTGGHLQRCESSDAEIAIWRNGGKLEQITAHDTVAGWVAADTVARVIAVLQAATGRKRKAVSAVAAIIREAAADDD